MDFSKFYIDVTDKIQGHIYYEEAQLLWDMALSMPDGATMMEIGCDLGRSTTVLAQVARMKNTSLHVIDSFVMSYNSPEIFTQNMITAGLNDVIDLRIGESISVSKKWKKPIDFLFIDADHSEEGIVADCEAWLPKIRSQGIVVFHDFNNPAFPGMEPTINHFTTGWETLRIAPLTLARRKP